MVLMMNSYYVLKEKEHWAILWTLNPETLNWNMCNLSKKQNTEDFARAGAKQTIDIYSQPERESPFISSAF